MGWRDTGAPRGAGRAAGPGRACRAGLRAGRPADVRRQLGRGARAAVPLGRRARAAGAAARGGAGTRAARLRRVSAQRPGSGAGCRAHASWSWAARWTTAGSRRTPCTSWPRPPGISTARRRQRRPDALADRDARHRRPGRRDGGGQRPGRHRARARASGRRGPPAATAARAARRIGDRAALATIAGNAAELCLAAGDLDAAGRRSRARPSSPEAWATPPQPTSRSGTPVICRHGKDGPRRRGRLLADAVRRAGRSRRALLPVRVPARPGRRPGAARAPSRGRPLAGRSRPRRPSGPATPRWRTGHGDGERRCGPAAPRGCGAIPARDRPAELCGCSPPRCGREDRRPHGRREGRILAMIQGGSSMRGIRVAVLISTAAMALLVLAGRGQARWKTLNGPLIQNTGTGFCVCKDGLRVEIGRFRNDGIPWDALRRGRDDVEDVAADRRDRRRGGRAQGDPPDHGRPGRRQHADDRPRRRGHAEVLAASPPPGRTSPYGRRARSAWCTARRVTGRPRATRSPTRP